MGSSAPPRRRGGEKAFPETMLALSVWLLLKLWQTARTWRRISAQRRSAGLLFEWRRHCLGATGVPTIAGEFREVARVVAIRAAVAFASRRVTVTCRMLTLLVLGHVSSSRMYGQT